MGDGNPRPGRNRYRRSDARNFLEGYLRLGQGEPLLAASAEDVGVAALQPDHHLPFEPLLHQERVDLLLGELVTAGKLSDVDLLGILTDPVQDLGGEEPIE